MMDACYVCMLLKDNSNLNYFETSSDNVMLDQRLHVFFSKKLWQKTEVLQICDN